MQIASENRVYKGIDLLDKVLEFTEMTPDKAEWNVDALACNPPRQVRLRQANALLNAFLCAEPKDGIFEKLRLAFAGRSAPSIDYFLNGGFILTRKDSDYAELYAIMNDLVKSEFSSAHADSLSPVKVKFIYPSLIDYKRQLRRIITFNSRWLEASSVPALFSIIITGSVTKNLEGKTGMLDKTLELIINPSGISFTEEELINHYDFPTEDLRSIDFDHW
jgi:hypothetical protein